MVGFSEVIILLIFISYLVYSLIFKIPSKPAVVAGTVFICLTALAVIIQSNPLADRAAQIAFYLFLVGAVQHLYETFRAQQKQSTPKSA